MTIQIKVRDTESGDILFLEKWLNHESSRKSYLPENAEEAKVSASMWMSVCLLNCSYNSSLTATVDGEPVGIVTLQLIPFKKIKHTAEFSIIVSPEYQRNGVGSNLMNEFFKMCKERFGLELIYLHIYQGSDSIKFYKKLGFIKFATQEKWLKDPSTGHYRSRIFLQKNL